MEGERIDGIQFLIDKISRYNSNVDLSPVYKAYEVAQSFHEGQMRASGDPYIVHPLAVANILADLKLDTTTITAGLLHDVVEDSPVVVVEDLVDLFGEEVAFLVRGVTKLNTTMALKLDIDAEEQHAENIRRMILAMAKDIRIVLIKLADRLHNMRTLKYLSPEKRQRIAQETLDIYAPIAHRLGIWTIKWELEDLALFNLKPDVYYELVDLVSKKRREREAYIEKVKGALLEQMKSVGIEGTVVGRAKHFYSIYEKMVKQNKSFDEIYDLLALRVKTESIKDCYAILGVVHAMWKPVPGRFKDYIAMPKSNAYQSLHTTVVAEGELLEVQIRTYEMDRVAEMGIAAHWLYKEGKSTITQQDEKLIWLRQVLEWQGEEDSREEFMELLKIDLYGSEVFVFTPKGKVIELPRGATPIDFAYSIHTEIGHSCIGAKVNGKWRPLNYQLESGDIVEIVTQKGHTPSPDWINIVKTARARNKIRHFLKTQQMDLNIMRGREMLERELAKVHLNYSDISKSDKVEEVLKRFGAKSWDDLLANIGYNRIPIKKVITRFLPPEELRPPTLLEKLEEKPPKRRYRSGVRVAGADNLFVRFAMCCNPIPGDDIVGFVTINRGVSIHRRDCPNIRSSNMDKARTVEVEWDTERDSSYPVGIKVEAMDRQYLMADILNAIANIGITISAASARALKDGRAVCEVTMEVREPEQLQLVISKVSKIRSVLDVYRSKP
ncbi:MAG: RelA/SpoT family protein [bacterium]